MSAASETVDRFLTLLVHATGSGVVRRELGYADAATIHTIPAANLRVATHPDGASVKVGSMFAHGYGSPVDLDDVSAACRMLSSIEQAILRREMPGLTETVVDLVWKLAASTDPAIRVPVDALVERGEPEKASWGARFPKPFAELLRSPGPAGDPDIRIAIRGAMLQRGAFVQPLPPGRIDGKWDRRSGDLVRSEDAAPKI